MLCSLAFQYDDLRGCLEIQLAVTGIATANDRSLIAVKTAWKQRDAEQNIYELQSQGLRNVLFVLILHTSGRLEAKGPQYTKSDFKDMLRTPDFACAKGDSAARLRSMTVSGSNKTATAAQ